jgi:hypothetical protein
MRRVLNIAIASRPRRSSRAFAACAGLVALAALPPACLERSTPLPGPAEQGAGATASSGGAQGWEVAGWRESQGGAGGEVPAGEAGAGGEAEAGAGGEAEAEAGAGGEAEAGAGGASRGGSGGAGGNDAGGGPLPEPRNIPCALSTVLSERCVVCHDSPPQAGAPYPLVTYGDLRAHADAVYAQVYYDAMPLGGPALSSEQKSGLLGWLAAGLPSGVPCAK